jgi:hypothetical protein
MTCYYYSLAYNKDESNTTSTPGRITASVIDLKSLPSTPSRRTETLHHHRPYRKVAGKSTLNKTDEHCRSLFNLLSTSLRPRHHQTSNNNGVDAVSMKNEGERKKKRAKKKGSIASYCCFDLCSDTSFIYHQSIYIYIYNKN